LRYICYPKIKAVFTAKILKICQNPTNPDSKKKKRMKNALLTQIIEQSFEDKNPFLNLGDLGLIELPEALTEMYWVEYLDLAQDSAIRWPTDFDFNIEKNRQILRCMSHLKSLDLSYNWGEDFGFLKDLTQLDYLQLNDNQISDISFLTIVRAFFLSKN
jgi:Leucine-rich repeat (LRR) protein